MTQENEATISKTSKVTMGLVIVVIGLLLVGAGTTITVVFTYSETRHSDREENRQGREEILSAIQELRDGQLSYQMTTDSKLSEIESSAAYAAKDRWPASVMKIWVLECQKAGTFVDPDPIIDRYIKQ